MKNSLFLLLTVAFFGCADSGISPPSNPLMLTVQDVTCVEAYLKLSLAENEAQRTLMLIRGDSTIAVIMMTSNDSVIIDKGLLPHKTYTYKLETPASHNTQSWSLTAQVTTMDTSSHDYFWHLDTLSNSITYPSVLYDVSIISDTVAFAVGEIHTNETDRFDSSGNWVYAYNAARWNGRRWELMRVFYIFGDGTSLNQIQSVFAFDEKNVWLGGNGLFRWDGVRFHQDEIPAQLWGPHLICKIWGLANKNLHVVGSDGMSAYFDGKNWYKTTSNTDLRIHDVYGTDNSVFAGGSNSNTYKGIVLKGNGLNWQTIAESELVTSDKLFKPKLYGEVTSVWVDEKNSVYAGGNLLFKYQFDKWDYVRSLPENSIEGNPNLSYRGFLTRIRGVKSNDMWIVGDRNTLRHFSGMNWQQIGLPYDPKSSIVWCSVDVKGKSCIAVGSAWNQAICIRIDRK